MFFLQNCSGQLFWEAFAVKETANFCARRVDFTRLLVDRRCPSDILSGLCVVKPVCCAQAYLDQHQHDRHLDQDAYDGGQSGT